ncbi:MAG TPA: efflux RND transporter periplasmic adaptor subunit [Casimicrobiaceae bacterium]|nr:efflux RND transporter periplasmic adaptor subunit [Casimicrobiaceae bacterium]
MKSKAAVGALSASLIVVAAAAGYWFGTQRTAGTAPTTAGTVSSAPKSGASSAIAVEAVKVAVQPMPQSITAVGSLRSDESITVRPEVAGRISEILFKEGERVARGTTLVRLDPAINKAEVEQGRANLKLAKSKYDRAVDLAKSNFISGQARDEAENNLRVAEAGVQLAEARLAKMEIKAPFSGIIGLRVVSVGDYAKEGSDIVNLESIDPLKVDFRVPEIYLKQIQVGQTLHVSLDAIPGKTFEGKVFAVNPLVDAAGRAIVIRALVRNSDTSLRPGMFARVRLITRNLQDALAVPEQAIVPLGDDQYVFKVTDGRAIRVKVEIGQRRDGKVEIVKGLEPTDMVVTAGHLKIRDGVPVTIVNGPSAAIAAMSPASTAPATATTTDNEGATVISPAKADTLARPPAPKS